MAEFAAVVYQNEFLPEGGTDVNAIVTVTCSGAGAAGRTGSGDAGEIIIVDTSGSMGRTRLEAAKQAADAALDEITDALVVDIAKGDEAWMPLFVVLKEGAELDEDLEKAIATRVREDCSPRHVPSEVFEVKEIPRTLSGKVLEVPVKKILSGTPPEQAASRDSLANPAALDWFAELAQ